MKQTQMEGCNLQKCQDCEGQGKLRNSSNFKRLRKHDNEIATHDSELGSFAIIDIM